MIAVQQAVPVLAGMVSTAAQPVLLGVIKLLGALASTHAEGRLQVRCCWVSTGTGKRSWCTWPPCTRHAWHACRALSDREECLTCTLAVAPIDTEHASGGACVVRINLSCRRHVCKLHQLIGAMFLAGCPTCQSLQAVECGCVPQMLCLLQNSSSEVAGAAAVALMMLTLAKEGKVAMHQVSLTDS